MLAATSAIAQTVPSSWTTFQGSASHDGYVPTILNPTGFSQRWQRSIGRNFNPVIAANGRVFVSESYQTGAINHKLHAYSAADGVETWTVAFPSQVVSVNPPAYGNGRVYIQIGQTSGGTSPYIAAFEESGGTQVFKTNYSGQWSGFKSPVAYRGNVIGAYDGGMFSYAGLTGSLNWSNSAPLLNRNWTPAVDGFHAYAFSNTGDTSPILGELTIVNLKTGATVASLLDDVPMVGIPISSIALGTQHDAITITDNRLVKWNVQSDATHTPHLEWAVTSGFRGQPSVANGVVYALDNGVLNAISESTGNKLWTWGSGLSGPIIVTKNAALVSDGTQTYAVDLQSHSSTWNYPKGGSLALSENTLYIGSSQDNTLTAINAPFGPPHFVWNKSYGDSWNIASNWTASGPAAGMDYIANFATQNLVSDAVVTLDGNQSIGGLYFADVGNNRDWTINSGTGGSLQLVVTSDSPEINVTNRTARINASLTGNQGFTKLGNGTLVLGGNNTYSGLTTIKEGKLSISANNNLSSDPVSLKGGTLAITGTFSSARKISLDDLASVIYVDNGCTYTATSTASISGGGGLTKSGEGTLHLAAVTTNWSGTTTVDGGVLTVSTLNNTSDIFVLGGTLNVNNIGSSIPIDVEYGATANVSASNASFGSVMNFGTINFTGTYGATTITVLNGAGVANFSAGVVLPILSSGTINVNGPATIASLSEGEASFYGSTANVNTLNNTGVFLGNSTVLTVKGGTQTAGGIYGDGSLVKTGSSTLILGIGNTISGGTLISEGVLQIGNGGTSGSLTGDVVNNATLRFSRSNSYVYSGNISGTGNLIKTGNGTTTLSGTNTYSGLTTISTGVLNITGSVAGPTSGDLTISVGTTLNIATTGYAEFGSVINNGTFTTANGGSILGMKKNSAPLGSRLNVTGGLLSSLLAIDLDTVTISGGAVLSITDNGTSTGVSKFGTLNIAAKATGGFDGFVDLKDNDLIIGTTSYSMIVSLVKSGLFTLGGNGTGIGSSTVNDELLPATMLAVVDNKSIGGQIKTSSGASVSSTSIIVKYTWFGDCNLDGAVDDADYALVDSGFTSGGSLTGWVYGDFDYNGQIDGADYALIDTGFIEQAGVLPEPAMMGLLGLISSVLCRRRRAIV